MDAPIIELSHVSKTFEMKRQRVEAVRDVSLHVRRGEVYGIIGFSGAGKSTLVRCINMLERPTAGTVKVDGVPMTELKERELCRERKKIGMIFQQFHLMPSRTALDNVALALYESGLSKQQIREKAERLLQYVGLRDKAEAYPSQLSGGQKQRVAIARALANDPVVLLCDEATSALDPQTTRSILELLQRLNRERNISVVVITHEMNVIKRICDRVAVMEKGRIVEEGEMFSLFTAPQQQITRDFIRTTSNLSEVYTLVARNDPLVDLKGEQLLVRMQFQRAAVSEPLISTVSKRYDVVCNILFGDLEIIAGAPLGGTVGIFDGKRENIEAALAYLRAQNISLEVIKDARTA